MFPSPRSPCAIWVAFGDLVWRKIRHKIDVAQYQIGLYECYPSNIHDCTMIYHGDISNIRNAHNKNILIFDNDRLGGLILISNGECWNWDVGEPEHPEFNPDILSEILANCYVSNMGSQLIPGPLSPVVLDYYTKHRSVMWKTRRTK